MSHGVTSTKGMAYSNNSRSFTSIGATATSDIKSTANSLNPTFGSTNKTWGSGNIWGNGSLSNGFTSRDRTRDNSRSRDASLQTGVGEVDLVEGKTGSGSLVNSSVSDDWSYRSPWGAKRSLPSARSISQAKYPEVATSQQRSVSNAGLPQPYSTSSQNMSSLGSRPPTINLSSTSSTQPRSSYGSAFSGSLSGIGSEQPPNVYTKFDRPVDPNSRKLPDSAKGGLWADSSPTDERSSQFGVTPSSRGSLPGSRNGSQPPSRHGEERPFFSKPDYSRPSLRPSQNNSRTPSLSSQGKGSYGGSHFSSNSDQLAYQFNQLAINGDNRPSTSYKPSIPSNTHFNPTPAFSGQSTFARSALNGFGSAVDLADDMDDHSGTNLNSFGLDGYISPHQPNGFPNYANPAFGGRFFETASIGDTRHGQTYSTGNTSLTAYHDSSGPRSTTEWQVLGNTTIAPNRSSRVSPEQAAYLDPRMQQLPGTTLRNPYSSLYNPYAVANPMPLGATAPFVPFLPMNLPGLGATIGSPEPPNGDNLTSAIMYEFKSNTKSKRYELKDIYNHIAEFSGDQHGSRFIQTKLETANSDEKESVFREIRPNALPLMTDVFGNYVIQKFFEHGDQTHKKILANMMKGQVLHLSLQMYGCRVVQKALDHVLVDQQAQLISELENNVLKCVKDQNGNHVIQKAIERCPPNTIGFIMAAFRGQVQHLSIHPYGCRVIQRCLERCEPHSKAMIMCELMDGIQSMISDQYGNYVVQHVVEHDAGEGRRRVLDIVGSGLEAYSKHKFASNVVEKCLEKSDDSWRREVLCTLATGDQRRCEGEAVLVGLIKDNFGNYVIQKLLDTLSPEDYIHFLDLLQPAMTQAKRTGCGKQVLSIEKKMHKFPSLRSGLGNVGSFNPGTYQLPLPTPPFASYHGSAATTPPPLTADTQSLQSSAIPSINGDAVEGAAVGSQKGSELSNDGHYLR